MHRFVRFALLGALVLAVADCGGSNPTTASPPSGSTGSTSTTNSNPGGTTPPPPGGSAATTTVAGFVPGAIPPTGACPAIRFGVESKSTGAYIDTLVVADSSTQYSGGACGDVALGVLLEVQGAPQADRSIHATLVKFTPKGAPVTRPR